MTGCERADVLTAAQKAVLLAARDHGHAFALTRHRQCAGGARRRMVDRLRERGLLTWAAPFRITEAGRDALTRAGAVT